MKHPATALIIFAYNRPQHLKNCLDSLGDNNEAKSLPLIIYIDGPKTDSDRLSVNTVAKIAFDEKRFTSVSVNLSEFNRGLSSSIKTGIENEFQIYDQLIILEDDLVCNPNFVKYMLDGLDKYVNDLRVASIQGFSDLIGNVPVESYFLRGADCWGFATWRNRWSELSWDNVKMRKEIHSNHLVDRFTFNFSYNFDKLLKMQIDGKINSWAISWQASTFLNRQYSLYPSKSLIINNGDDGSGTHDQQNVKKRKARDEMVLSKKYPEEIKELEIFYEARCRSLAEQNRTLYGLRNLSRKTRLFFYKLLFKARK